MTPTKPTSIRRPAALLAGLALAVGLLLSTAAAAYAYAPRTYESQLSAPASHLAVDSANRLFAAGSFGGSVTEFNPLGERLRQEVAISGSRIEGSIAADHSNHDLYVPDSFEGEISAYSPTGVLLPEHSFVRPGHLAIAADNSIGPTAGRLYLARYPHEGNPPSDDVELLSESGAPITFPRYLQLNPPSYINENQLTGTPAGPFAAPHAITVGPHGEIYVADAGKVDEFEPSGVFLREISASDVPAPEFIPGSLAVDPTTADLLVTNGAVIDEFTQSGVYLGKIAGTGPLQETPFANLADLAVNSAGFLYAATSTAIDVFSPTLILPKVTYRGVSGAAEIAPAEASATVGAEIDPRGGGEIKTCEFEYVEDPAYHPEAANPFAAGHTVSCAQPPPYSGSTPTQVSAEISNLTPGLIYRYRLLTSNENGTTEALPRTFDLGPPSLNAVSATNLTEATADLIANINPEGGDTTYRFDYGTTTAYGSTAPLPAADIGSLNSPQSVSVHLTNLEKGAVYHFRLVAENPLGAVASEDQTFNFLPPNCPNATVRQQSGTALLPDCRAYELVSPGNAGGTILFPEGPQSPLATQPSRLAFGGILGEIPEAGGEPSDDRGDLYVSTRTDTGWTTRFVGPSATQTLIAGGPPSGWPLSYILEAPAGALTDLKMSQFMDWRDSIYDNELPRPSYAPYLWGSDGHSLGRLPTNLETFPGGEKEGEQLTGAVKPSPEFNHYFFSSTSALPFAPKALSHAPGSAYDDNLEQHTVEIISKLPDGQPIEEGGGEYIAFPGVSTDGSHVLMSTGYSCTRECEPNYDFQAALTTSPHRVNAERHLFMRVGGGPGITYAIAPGHAVHYVGMTADASKVYFTSAEKLTSEAQDTSTNLYMWSEAKAKNTEQPLTLLSKPSGAGATGTPVCPLTNWTTECGVVPFLNAPSMFLPGGIINGGPGGNGLSDNAIAAENGDIYFYSPQQLDGTKGTLGQRNLYDYRQGKVQYVTTFDTEVFCNGFPACTEGPLARVQVSANDTHMAFLTASQITPYDNAGFLEMYTYDPTTGAVHCVSCLPDGAPPTSNVEASDNGLFMTEDGRVFFSTADPLVPQDTDGIRDVYEYVGGRPQLISSGTGSIELGIRVVAPPGLNRAGLIGVSANGTDVYFSTFDTLVPSDRNGSALKFYDARTDGGFAEPPAAAPCAAAEECAGPGSSPPRGIQNGTGADLGALGNLTPNSATHHKKLHKKHRRRAPAKGHSGRADSKRRTGR